MSIKLATTQALATPTREVSRVRRVLLVAAVLAGVATPMLTSAPVEAALPVPRAAVSMPAAIEPLARWQAASLCSPTAKPGAVKLMALLTTTYRGSRNSGISRSCVGTSKSEHKEGRAVDWGVRAWDPQEKAMADTFLRWALATDARGNQYANARRLGIMYIIWDDRIWTASHRNPGWQSYRHPACRYRSLATCGSTYRHRDHVHISLGWPGARAETSFWTGRVAGTPAPAPAPAPAPEPAPAPAPAPAPTVTAVSVAAYDHLVLREGAQGPAVTAVQRILGVAPAAGNFGPLTKSAVLAFQRAKGLPADGIVGPQTWAALQGRATRTALVAPYRGTTLQQGATGAAVTALQKTLVSHRVLNTNATGYFGSATAEAVRTFQRRNGLAVTATVTPTVWAKLAL